MRGHRLAGALAVAILLPGASAGHDAAATLGVSMAAFDDPFLARLRGEMRKAAGARGAAIRIEDARRDVGTQIVQIQALVARHVDAVIVVAVDTSATPKITRLVRAAGIPLVYVNRMPEDKALPAGVAYVGSDELMAGTLQGEAIARRLHGRGGVAILEGELDNNATALRTQGVERVIAAHPGMRLVDEQVANWQRAQAASVMQTWRAAGDRIDAIAANDDEMALGAILALKRDHADPGTIVIAGIDGLPDALAAIRDGALALSVFQDAAAQGSRAVATALDLAAGRRVATPVWIPLQLVTPENEAQFVGR